MVPKEPKAGRIPVEVTALLKAEIPAEDRKDSITEQATAAKARARTRAIATKALPKGDVRRDLLLPERTVVKEVSNPEGSVQAAAKVVHRNPAAVRNRPARVRKADRAIISREQPIIAAVVLRDKTRTAAKAEATSVLRTATASPARLTATIAAARITAADSKTSLLARKSTIRRRRSSSAAI